MHAAPERGLFTGNRGCVVDDRENVVRHHGGTLWIVCRTAFRGWWWPLARPRRWTPLFFLDDAVALAAGHRPCGTCRRPDLNRRLHRERHRRGRGLDRACDRIVWSASLPDLPDGTVVVDGEDLRLVVGERLVRFTLAGWTAPVPRPRRGAVVVLTPPTSVLALRHGYRPTLHPSATGV
jgi:hypothetical protein